ncbi:hypothetical protein QBC36DRAFT_367752 [Triangularia setosa]|uniref:Myb-like DNA-binding domain-containing protein n=1 Tax=Triangularia setosa TaxID=2587417 RepID=A0AAN6WAQ1_9PEZI|nr:hypothetical protein QBC36DRAFT_367752 [Podospora setosa]
MPPIDAEQHLKFLLSCIKHASAGKVNFDAVAQELGIVSKAAAAKRYERLLKAHDINPANIPKGGEPSPAKAGKATTKRKRGGASEVPPLKDEDDESEEQPMMAKKEKKTAAVKKGGKKGEKDDKLDGADGGKSLYDVPEYPRHLLASNQQKEGGEEVGDGDDDEEVVFLGQSVGIGSSTTRVVQEGTAGTKFEDAGNCGNGGNGWNFANAGFRFEQPSSTPLVMMRRSEGTNMMMMGERSNPDPPSHYFAHAAAHVQELPREEYGGGGLSSSAASVVSGDVDLQQIYQRQFGDRSYEHGWDN